MAQAKQLVLISETELDSRAPRGFPVGCPTLDVALTWDSGSSSLVVYRPPGQVISKVHQLAGAQGEAAPEAVTATWSPDGQFLAVGWSDGIVRLIRLENNKVAHRIQGTGAQITHIGWTGSNMPKPASTSATNFPTGNGGLPLNLPQALTFLDVDSALPKISPLPSGSSGADEDANVFTLRASVDFLFQPLKQEDHDTVNVMVVGTSDGKVQLSIYNSFVIGTFQCPTGGDPNVSQLVHHASHPDVSTHALILADDLSETREVQVLPLDLPFVSSSQINLSLLASKLTTLQKLLRYLKQTQLHMQVEWRNARELPARFLRSIQADLADLQSGPRGIVPALYHVVVTGHAYEPVREWLVDTIADRGHKRWEKAVVSGLENLRSLVHENFLPALERCALILSRLRGLAQFHDDRDDIGFSVSQISRVLDIISCLHLAGHKILVHVMDELEHFAAFSVWLRFQIDGLTGPASQELTEREATMDTSRVLTYIETYLTSSPLDMFFDGISTKDFAADWDHCEDGPSLLQMLDTQLKKREDGQSSMRALPHVDFLVNYMTTWCDRIFKSVAERMEMSVRFGMPIKLSVGAPISKMDVRVGEAAKGGVIYTAVACRNSESKVYILRAEMDIAGGISRNLPATGCCIDLANRQLIDTRFLNDETLIVLCKENDLTSAALSIPVQSSELPYAPLGAGGLESVNVIPAHGFVKYVLPEQQAARMEVHDKSEVKGQIPPRICLLSNDGTRWRTYSM
ncbi:anaphase-promoting complex component Cut20/Apc4 [Ophiocordyceps camponoti-floridani]|uniref:Anaphase-promoting complex subunit 4 n=1 Tax=Ophiocordyceps camponoti-floridani TaxID=2030778 RepID=A0A8H4Q9D0_9HYPO|nr:anaphase-promoting complex component Cut20/Apc4 [Ophiocordyceps camponoti-floridani]